uniref:Uncharacterized protein n=1 Tax=Strigamia maritima TaxID=126957 RepID=T1JPA0_STRMM
MDSVCPDSTPLSGSENDNLEKNAEKMDDVDKMSKGSENTIYSICEFLTNDDFVCLKMLSALWLIPRPNFKIKRSDVKTPMILFKSLHNRVTDDVEFNSIIIELLFTIKRYDLLKKLKVCKHNSAKFIQNRIDPIWKECFKLVEQFDPNGKDVEKFVINLTTLVQSEKNPRLEWILESLLDLIDSTILDEIRIKINELTDLPYPMDGDPCGICLIINNKKFDNPKKFPARDGTEADKGEYI